MRARVYNRNNDKYYISEVYGIINRAGDWYIVDDPDDKAKAVLLQYLGKVPGDPYSMPIEVIDTNPVSGNWGSLSKDQINEINGLIMNSPKLHYGNGYMEIWNNTGNLVSFLDNGTATKKDLGIGAVSTKLEGWNYIETEADIDLLMQEYAGFHDSVLKEMSYISGDYTDGSRMFLKESGSKQIRLVYNSDWAKEIEVILLSPRGVHLYPAQENYMANLYDASIKIRDCKVFLYHCSEADIGECDCSYFEAMGMMWRYTL